MATITFSNDRYRVEVPGHGPDYYQRLPGDALPSHAEGPLEIPEPAETAHISDFNVSRMDLSNLCLTMAMERDSYSVIWSKCGGSPPDVDFGFKHRFVEWLRENPVQELDCSGEQIAYANLSIFGEMSGLQRLILVGCGLKDIHAPQLESALANRTLEVIDLRDNPLLKVEPELKAPSYLTDMHPDGQLVPAGR